MDHRAVKFHIFLTLAFVFLAAGFVTADDDYPVSVQSLPQAVTAAVQEYLPGAEIVSAKSDEDDGRRQFELKADYKGELVRVEVRPNGRVREIDLDREYKGFVRILGREASLERVDVAQLPEAVKASIAEFFPGSKIVSALQGEERGRTIYRLRARHGDLLLRTDVRADGRILDIDTEK